MMNEVWLKALELTLAQAAATLLALGAGFGLLTGLGLLIAPARVFALSARLERWTAANQAPRGLDAPHFWERFFYRHHRAWGSLIIAGGAYALFVLARHGDSRVIAAALGVPRATTVVAALRIALLMATACVLPFGLVVLIRPSLMKPLERHANRWISTGWMHRPLTGRGGRGERLLRAYPRCAGICLVVAATYILLSLALVSSVSLP